MSETAGISGNVRLEFPFLRLERAYTTNLVEENEAQLEVQQHALDVAIKAFGLATVRLLPSA